MLHWIETHGFEMLVSYFVFNCLVSPLPTPNEKSSGFYRYIYGVLHSLLNFMAGNIARFAPVRAFLGNGNMLPGGTKPNDLKGGGAQ